MPTFGKFSVPKPTNQQKIQFRKPNLGHKSVLKATFLYKKNTKNQFSKPLNLRPIQSTLFSALWAAHPLPEVKVKYLKQKWRNLNCIQINRFKYVHLTQVPLRLCHFLMSKVRSPTTVSCNTQTFLSILKRGINIWNNIHLGIHPSFKIFLACKMSFLKPQNTAFSMQSTRAISTSVILSCFSLFNTERTDKKSNIGNDTPLYLQQ